MFSQILTEYHQIETSIRTEGLGGGMKAAKAFDPSKGLRERWDWIRGPIFAAALREYQDQAWSSFQETETSEEAYLWRSERRRQVGLPALDRRTDLWRTESRLYELSAPLLSAPLEPQFDEDEFDEDDEDY